MPLLKQRKNDNNFVNESHLHTQGKTIVKTYTTTAQEPSIYDTSNSSVFSLKRFSFVKCRSKTIIVLKLGESHPRAQRGVLR